ncbi:FAD-dependent thymidylate synthase [soil metagenome]
MNFISTAPVVRLTKAFATPYRNVVATAKTCYSSKGIVEDSQVGEREKFAPLAQSIYEAGHHTTFQHAHFQFAMENVSRHFLWSFLHSHPFYNSEQVSQRYVTVKPDTVAIPELPARQAAIYRECVELMFEAYQRLCLMLAAPARAEFYKRFNHSERMEKKHAKSIEKRSQEAARYILPVATHAYLYHTVSGLTLLRYYRLANQFDTPSEQRVVLQKMVDELLSFDRDYEITLQQPMDAEALPEFQFFAGRGDANANHSRAFCEEFDGDLAGLTSKLIAFPQNGERLVADAVREILGLPTAALGDEEAIRMAADPGVNRVLGDSLNLTTIHKLSRALCHPHFTFKKKISHAADSQDQRHRMTPGSRPILAAHMHDAPDFETPQLIAIDEASHRFYKETMARVWEKIAALRREGAPPEALAYLLPNAASIRFTESSDFLNLRHKHQMRLCYNAQEEIWKASVEEARQIRDVLPLLGSFLLPPCGVRAAAKQKPICPEGPRYCGVRVWKLDLGEYERVI